MLDECTNIHSEEDLKQAELNIRGESKWLKNGMIYPN
jgi:hypothetical protein